MQGSQGPRFVGHAINCLCVVIQMKYFCDRNFPWPPAAARSATTASKPGLSPGIYTGGVACVVHGPEAHGAGTRRARVRLRPGPHKSGPANTFGVADPTAVGFVGECGPNSHIGSGIAVERDGIPAWLIQKRTNKHSRRI